MRALREREIVVRVLVDNEGGELLDADSTPSVVVKDGAGSTIGSVSAVTKESEGVYKATVPARSTLDVLDVVWTVVVGGNSRTVRNKVSVISERLASLPMLREDEELRDLSSAALNKVADVVETWFRRALRYPPVLEGVRKTWRTGPTGVLLIPDVLYPVTLVSLVDPSGAAVDVSTVEVGRHGLRRSTSEAFLTGSSSSAWAPGTYTAHVEHGLQDPPDDLRRAAAIFARYVSRTSNYPERASKVISAETEIYFSVPSPEKPTGLPEVDAVVADLAIPLV